MLPRQVCGEMKIQLQHQMQFQSSFSIVCPGENVLTDCDPLGMYGAQVAVFKQVNDEVLCSLQEA